MPDGRHTLECVLSVTKTSVGIFGDYPPFNQDRSGAEWGGLKESFRLWGEPVNTAELLRRGGRAKLGQLTCVLPQSVSDTVLDRLEHACKQYGTLTVEDTWPALVGEIDAIGWAFVAPSDEDRIALFICRLADSIWMDELREVLKKEGIPFASVVAENGIETWHFGEELRRVVWPDDVQC